MKRTIEEQPSSSVSKHSNRSTTCRKLVDETLELSRVSVGPIVACIGFTLKICTESEISVKTIYIPITKTVASILRTIDNAIDSLRELRKFGDCCTSKYGVPSEEIGHNMIHPQFRGRTMLSQNSSDIVALADDGTMIPTFPTTGRSIFGFLDMLSLIDIILGERTRFEERVAKFDYRRLFAIAETANFYDAILTEDIPFFVNGEDGKTIVRICSHIIKSRMDSECHILCNRDMMEYVQKNFSFLN